MTKSASAGIGRQPVGRDHGDAPTAQRPGERQLGQALGQRHDRGDGQGGRAADEDVDPQRLTPADRRRVVHADPAMDLIMQPDLAVGSYWLPASWIRYIPRFDPLKPGPVGVFGINLRQGDERPAVHRPALDLRQLIDRRSDAPGSARSARAGARSRQSVRGVPRYRQGFLASAARINLELDQPAHRLERVAKHEFRPIERAEQVAQNRERRPLDPAKEQGGPARLIDPALDGGDFEIGVDLLVDDDELPVSFQVADAFRQ